ncbi:hypothetical protein JW899_03560 [Candidatus Uhrbacteria bacterium]|nr:hypothetical protein [Candidatus Uhrbacteria bacterium]
MTVFSAKSAVSRLNRRFAPFLSEIGRVFFAATAVFVVLATVLEAFRPGFVINWIAPKTVFVLLSVFGLLSFWPPEPETPVGCGRVRSLFPSLLAGAFSGLAAWDYFGGREEVRLLFSLAAAGTALAAVWLLTVGRHSGSMKRERERNS